LYICLSIKNNDTNALNFSITKLQLHTGNQVFTPADPGIIHFMGWVSSEIENENRLNDTLLLHPDQTRCASCAGGVMCESSRAPGQREGEGAMRCLGI
jgi:hypothetical protein